MWHLGRHCSLAGTGTGAQRTRLGLGGLKGHAEYVPHEGDVTHFLSYEGDGTRGVTWEKGPSAPELFSLRSHGNYILLDS